MRGRVLGGGKGEGNPGLKKSLTLVILRAILSPRCLHETCLTLPRQKSAEAECCLCVSGSKSNVQLKLVHRRMRRAGNFPGVRKVPPKELVKPRHKELDKLPNLCYTTCSDGRHIRHRRERVTRACTGIKTKSDIGCRRVASLTEAAL